MRRLVFAFLARKMENIIRHKLGQASPNLQCFNMLVIENPRAESNAWMKQFPMYFWDSFFTFFNSLNHVKYAIKVKRFKN